MGKPLFVKSPKGMKEIGVGISYNDPDIYVRYDQIRDGYAIEKVINPFTGERKEEAFLTRNPLLPV
jgi:hypothetical protein